MERICEHCQSVFHKPPSVVRKGKGRWCSAACYFAANVRSTKAIPPETRFWSKVNKDGPVPQHCAELGPCWIWTGAADRAGYGHFGITEKKFVRCPRFAYEITYGPILGRQVVRHKCDNPQCVNPSHLCLGTHADNSADAIERERLARGELHGSSVLTAEDIPEIRRLHISGTSQARIATIFGVHVMTVNDVIHRRTWRHV